MQRFEIFALIILFFYLFESATSQKPPRAYAKTKCEKRVKNETLLQQCKSCVENYSLPEYPTKSEIRNLVRACVPKKNPKEWVKGKCEDNTEKQADIEACYQCVDDFILPQNVTRDDVQSMRKACLPQPSLKFRAKRKCAKKLKNKEDVEICQLCINEFKISDKPSCEEVNEMKRKCITERSGRELWVEPVMDNDDDDE
ncbi:uncharacterized protein [Parasteatoda tepidariorum]|uniref:uncharacterized protein n=1 Tax=Parasteatoda tepidariorum TaxID=114398 RepID=UPI00077FD624|nr:uncharacterized protein LOC107447444 isoform X1 [Parasteatoda tepidariorum]